MQRRPYDEVKARSPKDVAAAIRAATQSNVRGALEGLISGFHPIDIALAMNELDPDERSEVFRLLTADEAGVVLEEVPDEIAADLAEETPDQELAEIIDAMPPDAGADVVELLDEERAHRVLSHIPREELEELQQLRQYGPETAGGLMRPDVLFAPEDLHVWELAAHIRNTDVPVELLNYIYVVDNETDRRLVGTVSLPRLVKANPDALLGDIAERDIITVGPDTAQEEVVRLVNQYNLAALPVVDENMRLLGIVTHDDVLEVAVREATEDMQLLGGVMSITENYLRAPFLSVWRRRVTWLALLFIAELFTFSALAHFEDSIAKIVVLSLFIPLCISTGGNSGSQAATLIIRALALGQVKLAEWWRVLRHEILMGLALGISLGAIAFVRASLTPHDLLRGSVEWWQLAAVVSSAVAAICLWGTLVGSGLPMLLRRLGFDPAFASSPFVATFVDVTGIIIYFSIAAAIIPGLR
ncbi:MAG: magnesium transporter [Armatimonadetes bacterium]|nr:magnesium transporter [Armatimonadota bacterium]